MRPGSQIDEPLRREKPFFSEVGSFKLKAKPCYFKRKIEMKSLRNIKHDIYHGFLVFHLSLKCLMTS